MLELGFAFMEWLVVEQLIVTTNKIKQAKLNLISIHSFIHHVIISSYHLRCFYYLFTLSEKNANIMETLYSCCCSIDDNQLAVYYKFTWEMNFLGIVCKDSRNDRL